MSAWIEVKAWFDQAPEDWSPWIDAFDRFGCPGTLQTDQPPTLSGFFPELEGAREQAECLKRELVRIGAREATSTVVPEEDWAELWKQHFKPRRIGQRLVVRPSWEEYDAAPGDVEIVLDPGQAFGTGEHPTTRLCLELLEALELQGKSVADVGCGSGILAVAAVKLGAARVLATDLDLLAVEVAKENAGRNGVSFECFVAEGMTELAGQRWDVVLSNIISATLIRLAPGVPEHLVPGGCWIVSGIIENNWPDVLAAAERAGLKLERHLAEDGWVAATFRL
jgi:ribosomal protein L11 methyltransferase